jgi:hypothetical protein
MVRGNIMVNITCSNCGNGISSETSACAECGQPNKKTSQLSVGYVLVGLIVGVGLIWWLSGSWRFSGGGLGLEPYAAKEMQRIENKTAADAINQYGIAKRQGDPIQICKQAGFVSAAYLQAKDEPNYQRWEKIEKDDCSRAGVPR